MLGRFLRESDRPGVPLCSIARGWLDRVRVERVDVRAAMLTGISNSQMECDAERLSDNQTPRNE